MDKGTGTTASARTSDALHRAGDARGEESQLTPTRRRREQSTRSVTKMLDVHAVADAIGVSEKTVRRLVARRSIPFHKIGPLVRFDEADIRAWLDESRVEHVVR